MQVIFMKMNLYLANSVSHIFIPKYRRPKRLSVIGVFIMNLTFRENPQLGNHKLDLGRQF
ncbi:hypothetical protein BIY27_23785 [Gibbsiella quercinecans]|nr:hypothetical protein BIY27_23785 [Gibbsiella quercinecans]